MSSVLNQEEVRAASGQALGEVLGQMLSLPVTAADRGATGPGASAPGWVAAVALCGARVTGEVRLHLSDSFLRESWGRLLGDPGSAPPEPDAVRDLAGELVNMVAGRVAASLGRAGWSCELGTPVVTPAASASGSGEGDPGGVQTDWICAGHWLTLEVRCHPGAT